MIQIIAMAAFICCLNPLYSNGNHEEIEDFVHCNDNVQISISGNCTGVTPDHFLEGTGSVGPYYLQITDEVIGVAPNESSEFAGIDWSKLIGAKGMKYKIIDGNSADCWGTFDLEANVLPEIDLSPCSYIEGSNITTTATLQPGATDKYTFVITDECQSYNVMKGADGLKIECDTDPSGWCTIDCKVEIKNASGTVLPDLSGSGLSPGEYTVCVSADNPTFLGSYDISISVTDCGIPCENWCDSPPPSEFVTVEELEEMLASSCMANVEFLTENILTSGEICDEGGILNIVKYSAQYDSHGETVLVDIMTQAYRSLPVDLYMPGTGSGTVVACTGSGTLNPIFTLPADISLNCNDDFSPEGIAAAKGDAFAWPTILDVHTDIPEFDITCTERHIVATTDTVITPVEISPGVWSNVKKVIKGLRDTIICDTVALGTFTNPRVPLSSGLYCNIFSSYEDFEVKACGGGKKVVRSWKLIDWCTNSCYETQQNIEVTDTEAPKVVEGFQATQTFNIDPLTCKVNLNLGGPTFTDNCNTAPKVNLELTENKSGIILDPAYVPVGEYTATYIASDGCGNTSDPVVIEVTVTEDIIPIAVCKDIVVSLTPDMNYVTEGIAKLYAETFDKGSHDSGCGEIVKMEVIRMEDLENGVKTSCDPILEEVVLKPDSIDKFGDVIPGVTGLQPVFGEYVKFCCEDVGQDRQVVLQVYDNQGNSNRCMVNVVVQDKLSGSISCPNYTVSCIDFPDNPMDNAPTILKGSCDDLEVSLLSEEVGVGNCGVGRVLREWGALQNGVVVNTCVQLVTITAKGGFDPRDIKWPLHHTDEENVIAYNKEEHPETGVCTLLPEPTTTSMKPILNCGDLDNAELCTPSFPGVSCGLIGLSHEDTEVIFDEGACLKIIRRWTVIDWCTYESNSSGNLEDNNDTNDDSFFVCIDWCETDACQGNYYFKYDEVEEDGYYTFDQVLKIIDEQAPTVDCEGLAASSSFDGTACTGSITASAIGQDNGDCPSSDLTWNIILKGADGKSVDIQRTSSAIGEEVTYSVAGIPEGDYTVCFVAIDACGNDSEPCNIPVSILDSKAPTPICIQRLSTAVMQAGEPQVAIWAVDYNVKSEDNCTPQEDLRFSFSEDSIVGSMSFNCSDVTGFPIELQMWVWDNSDNRDFCYVEVRVDGELACEDNVVGEGMTAIVSGLVQTEQGEMIDNTDVSIMSTHPEYPSSNMTNNDGHYAFMNNPMHLDYQVTANKNIDHSNGVSTLDLVLINKHILGTALLDSPYKIIAADINNNGSVSASDLVQLRKLILGLIVELPNNESWRFLDAGQSFMNPYSPWPFIESIDVVNLDDDHMHDDFIGVKIGDVNATAKANSAATSEIRSKTNKFLLTVRDQELKQGEVSNIAFEISGIIDLMGLQFTLDNQGLEILDVVSEIPSIDQNNFGVFDEQTTFSYNASDESQLSNTLFTLEVKANRDLKLSDILTLNSRITQAEAYITDDLEIADLQLEFETEEATEVLADVTLYQNVPNPFTQNTTVTFSLPVQSTIKFQIHDYAGKLVYEKVGEYNSGINKLELTKEMLNTSGVYYYSLISDKANLTKSMIRIE